MRGALAHAVLAAPVIRACAGRSFTRRAKMLGAGR